ncbi:zinc ribbon domain-containing protein [Collinsella sp. zg1085]|uniref:double zinc ribbon domain-containing protein n=1 Tax=Collinsella sp. zg1085 TaxID=2844380 RepID=UPI001C0B7404|nr:zinc ribbon domain-containing protein [Collinsella sp. zg1085]QWT17065.1 zinc ribbon domain-containing protein [Collinsella sp. zg1085]
MICPHCLMTVADETSFCPHCHAYMAASGESTEHTFIFCEGCGARLSAHDRTCAKCGRPAPGILSTSSSSEDLAAGKTAGFPRLTQNLIDTSVPDSIELTASLECYSESTADPFATDVLPVEAVTEAEQAAQASMPDRYHAPNARITRTHVILVLAACVIAAGIYIVAVDPWGLMPRLMAQIQQSAREMYPSRYGSSTGAQTEREPIDDKAQETQDTMLSEAQAYRNLTNIYTTIVAQHDALEQIINDFNSSFLASNPDARADGSASAYAARDLLQDCLNKLDTIQLADGSGYADTVAHLKELASWVLERVGMYCAAWDISRSYIGSDKPAQHQDEILAPLRERAELDAQARDNFFAHQHQYQPKPPENKR